MKLTKDETMMANMPSLRRYDLYGKRDAAPAIADMTVEQRREYDRIKRRESRAAQKKAKADGAIKPTAEHVRDALAHAALMLLAVDGPGSQQVQAVLGKVFAARPGVVLTVTAAAKRGKLKPKLFRP
jgi:hypothetical protein